MIRLRRCILLVAVLLALGAAVTTSAFTGGDEAVQGVYLDPADTPNGQQYAEIDSNGDFRINISNLNPHSTSVVDDVFVIGTTYDEARVWIEDEEPRVDFYRMDGRESVEASNDPVTVTDDDPVLVGLEVVSGNSGVVLETITLHGTIPDQTSEGGTGGDDGSDSDSTPTDTPTETPTDTPTETPDDGSGDGETETPTDTPTDTATPDSGTPADGGSPTPTDTPTTTQAPGGGAPSADLQVVNVSISPASPGVGEEITVTVTVENRGTTTGTQTVEIRAGGDVIGTETVTLEPGERRTITGTVTFDRAGSYEVAVLDESRTVTVAEQDDSPLEIGSLGGALLGLLALLGAGLALFALWRRDDPDFVVAADDESWSSFELSTDSADGTTVTDEDGRTRLAFDVGRDGGTLDPAFTVRNAVAETAGLRIVPVDGDGQQVTDGVRVEAPDGSDLTAFPAGPDGAGILDGDETIAVKLVFEDGDAVEAIETLRVERGSTRFD